MIHWAGGERSRAEARGQGTRSQSVRSENTPLSIIGGWRLVDGQKKNQATGGAPVACDLLGSRFGSVQGRLVVRVLPRFRNILHIGHLIIRINHEHGPAFQAELLDMGSVCVPE